MARLMEEQVLFLEWYQALEERHLRKFEFREVRKALQALSVQYVQRRDRLVSRRALDSAGKRAAYALFYGPLHFLQVAHVLRGIGASDHSLERILDLGCGTGAAGAAWGLALERRPLIEGVDVLQWAVEESAWTYQFFGLRYRTRRADLTALRLPGRGCGIALAFTANEMGEEGRSGLLRGIIGAAKRGAAVLVVEPISRRVSPWWKEWVTALETVGAESRDWKFREDLPETLRLLDKAAGLRHDYLSCRSLWVPPPV